VARPTNLAPVAELHKGSRPSQAHLLDASEIANVLGVQREGVHQGSGGNQGVGHAERREVAPQLASTLCDTAIDGDLVHPSQKATDAGFIVCIRSSQELASGDDRIAESPSPSR
jgi:hypothetical protein